jgi:hypothetical protein
MQQPRSAEEEAVAVRLMAIASRGKAASLPDWEEEPLSSDRPDETPSMDALQ